MDRPKATTEQILGREAVKVCFFKKLFHYEPCRSCSSSYALRCDNYFPVHSPQTQIQLRTPLTAKGDVSLDKTADTYSQMSYELIRLYNDGVVI